MKLDWTHDCKTQSVCDNWQNSIIDKKDGYRQRNVRQFLQSAIKAQFGYLRSVTPVCRCLHPFCGWRHLATSRESKAHFGLPWVRRWDNRGKCYMDGKRIQCLSNALQHEPIYLQPFPSNSTRKFILAHFFAHFGLPWVRPWANRGKCYMDGKRIQCWSNAS